MSEHDRVITASFPCETCGGTEFVCAEAFAAAERRAEEAEQRYLSTNQQREMWQTAAEAATSKLAAAQEEIARLQTEHDRWQRELDSAKETIVSTCPKSRKYEVGKQAAFLRDELLSYFDPVVSIYRRLRDHKGA